jgi:predicted RNA-binding Zn ribbon-like protein
MSIIDQLFGGQRKQDFENFVDRYEQGRPSEGYDDQEVIDRYSDVAHQISDEDYEDATQRSLERLSPEERVELGQHLRERARERRLHIPELNQYQDENFQNSSDLAGLIGKLHKNPGQLRDLLRGRSTNQGGSIFDNPLAKAALAGIAAMAVKRLMGRR